MLDLALTITRSPRKSNTLCFVSYRVRVIAVALSREGWGCAHSEALYVGVAPCVVQAETVLQGAMGHGFGLCEGLEVPVALTGGW